VPFANAVRHDGVVICNQERASGGTHR